MHLETALEERLAQHVTAVEQVLADHDQQLQVALTDQSAAIGTHFSAERDRLIGELKVVREEKAKELAIHPSLLATNAMLEALVKKVNSGEPAFSAIGGPASGGRGAGIFLPWQADLLSEEFLKILIK